LLQLRIITELLRAGAEIEEVKIIRSSFSLYHGKSTGNIIRYGKAITTLIFSK